VSESITRIRLSLCFGYIFALFQLFRGTNIVDVYQTNAVTCLGIAYWMGKE
jgi:hypothetical protein